MKALELRLGLEVETKYAKRQTVRALAWIGDEVVVHYRGTAYVDRYALDEFVRVYETEEV